MVTDQEDLPRGLERAGMKTHMDQSEPRQDLMASNGAFGWVIGSIAQNLPGY